MLGSKELRQGKPPLSLFASRAFRALCLTTLIPFFNTIAINAQEPEDTEVLRVTTDLLVFPVRVVDKDRRSVLNLTVDDFDFQDRDQVTSDKYFSAGTGRVAILFALDESGSLREIISQQHDAAIALFSHFRDDSRVAALRFGEQPNLVASFDAGPEAIREAFNFPARRDQHTAIFDAAYAAVELFSKTKTEADERCIVVLISDGLDNASHVKPSMVIAAAADANVSFYVIHLPLFTPREGRLSVRPPAKGFRDLAEKSGGKYFLAADAASPLSGQARTELGPVFKAIEEDIKSQYLLGFYLNENARDGKSHRISVRLKPKGLVYSTRNQRFARAHDFVVDQRAPKRVAVP